MNIQKMLEAIEILDKAIREMEAQPKSLDRKYGLSHLRSARTNLIRGRAFARRILFNETQNKAANE